VIDVIDGTIYERGFSFFSFHRAERPTPETLTTLKRTPGISPFALPLRPKPARRTSSFSSTKFKQPSLGTVRRDNGISGCPFFLAIPLLWELAQGGGVERLTESSHLLSVLDELDTDTLANGRVGLLGLDSDLFKDNALCVRGTTEGRRLVRGSQKALLVVEIGPTTLTAGVLQLARGIETSWLSFTHDGCNDEGVSEMCVWLLIWRMCCRCRCRRRRG